MKIDIDSNGYCTDSEGKQFRLVPVQPVPCQTEAALAKAKRAGYKGKYANAQAWDYMMGYMELVKFSPVPFFAGEAK